MIKMDDGDKMILTRMVMMRMMLMADNDDDVEHAARSVWSRNLIPRLDFQGPIHARADQPTTMRINYDSFFFLFAPDLDYINVYFHLVHLQG